MTVPLDRLYNFLDDVVNQDILIYRWYPHGSKLLDDIKLLKYKTGFERVTTPIMLCHDQEPLDYYLYSEEEILDAVIKIKSKVLPLLNRERIKEISRRSKFVENYIQEIIDNKINLYDKYILLNSEKNSTAIDDYVQHGAVPVYYFSHALIARDWFRYAEIDPVLSNKNIKKDFLVYQRAWSGSREYRLKFSELMLDADLLNHCLASFNSLDNRYIHYIDHKYKNNCFQIQRTDLENYFSIKNTPSQASADYVANDYCETRYEIVLETMFDDQRWHLTEKTFRPIACGHPFILASTPGALDYLKSYGFKTFGDYIDESYDKITDPVERLSAIIRTMKSISSLSVEQKENLSVCLQPIVDFNKNWFFSKEFFNNIVSEYQNNLTTGLEFLRQHRGSCLERWDILRKKDLSKYIITDKEYQELLNMI
jgi:hypothetical protein